MATSRECDDPTKHPAHIRDERNEHGARDPAWGSAPLPCNHRGYASEEPDDKQQEDKLGSTEVERHAVIVLWPVKL